jgi:hypothetical protein
MQNSSVETVPSEEWLGRQLIPAVQECLSGWTWIPNREVDKRRQIASWRGSIVSGENWTSEADGSVQRWLYWDVGSWVRILYALDRFSTEPMRKCVRPFSKNVNQMPHTKKRWCFWVGNEEASGLKCGPWAPGRAKGFSPTGQEELAGAPCARELSLNL